MNGFKRASRRQAAVIGLTVLMGATFLGCHNGPRLFSKKDHESRVDKQELAEKDKGKFINRKKVRPESDYRRVEDERVAKAEPKAKSKTKASDSIRKPTKDDDSRAVAARKKLDDKTADSSRSTKTDTKSKTVKPAEQPQIAKRDTSRRPITDLRNDSFYDEKLPETRSAGDATLAKKAATKPTTTAKSRAADEDPFKNVVVGPSKQANPKKPDPKVAPVNFDDDSDEDLEEAAEELEEAREAAAKTRVAAATTPSQRVATIASQPRHKFIDDLNEEPSESFQVRDRSPQLPKAKPAASASTATAKRSTDGAKAIAGQEVIDRRLNVQQTLNDWRRELDADDAPAAVAQEPVAPSPRSTARTNPSNGKGHISQTSIEEFTPPAKSQGATLNGDLIIDTTTLPSRFQRPASNTNGTGRINSNSGASIDIVPGATQNRARPAGQISLQSLYDDKEATGLTTADYEQSGAADDLGSLPSLRMETDSESGVKLASLGSETDIAPAPPEIADIAASIATEMPSGSRGWKRTILVLSAMLSAIAIGFGLRRRMEFAAVSANGSKHSSPPNGHPQNPAEWPRG